MALFVTLSKYLSPSDPFLSYRSIRLMVQSLNFRDEGGNKSVRSNRVLLKESKSGVGSDSS